jgi:hypothetical protein
MDWTIALAMDSWIPEGVRRAQEAEEKHAEMILRAAKKRRGHPPDLPPPGKRLRYFLDKE